MRRSAKLLAIYQEKKAPPRAGLVIAAAKGQLTSAWHGLIGF
jgi:hypothetical protein